MLELKSVRKQTNCHSKNIQSSYSLKKYNKIEKNKIPKESSTQQN
jgi:hypothetical protein